MKVLVTGSNGQLGRSLNDCLQDKNRTSFLFKTSNELDITNEYQLKRFFENNKLDYVVNCAAYTNVELAEEEEEKCFLVNATAVKYLAEQCLLHDVILIHISTDYVFDGNKQTPYEETDATNPLNSYGRSKLKGEELIDSILNKYFIIRTSWLYSKDHGNNFFKFVINSLESEKEISILDNQFGSPTNSENLAEVILKIVYTNNKNYGLYHYTNLGITNWYEYAKAIAKIHYPEKTHLIIPTSDYPTKAKRANYTKLDTEKIIKTLSITIPNWFESLKN